jgi:hypothetical protein
MWKAILLTELGFSLRLVGLHAMDAAVTSDVFYSGEFKALSRHIIPALLYNLTDSDNEIFEFVKEESVDLFYLSVNAAEQRNADRANRIETDTKPFDRMYRPPLADRRARSIRVTKRSFSDDKGPEARDVALSALRIFRSLFRLAHNVQIGHALEATVEFLDAHDNGIFWTNPDWCCWLAESMTKWTHLQYRFVLLGFFIDQLVALGPQSGASPKQATLTLIVKTILTSRASLVGLAIGDVLAQLIGLIIRRARLAPHDPLIQPLVECVIGLAAHVYYADQICDIAQDIIANVVALQLREDNETVSEDTAPPAAETREMQRSARDEATCTLIQCLVGVLKTASNGGSNNKVGPFRPVVDSDATLEGNDITEKTKEGVEEVGKAPDKKSSEVSTESKKHATRNRVPPNAFYDILFLLSEGPSQVRLGCAHAVVTYIRDELPPPLRETHPLESSTPAASRPVTPDVYKRFISSVHAHAFTLLASALPAVGPSSSRRASISRSRASSNAEPPKPTPADFAAVREILDALYARQSASALLTGLPMLIALDRRAISNGDSPPETEETSARTAETQLATRQVISSALRVIGNTWGLVTPKREADKVCLILLAPSCVPYEMADKRSFGYSSRWRSSPGCRQKCPISDTSPRLSIFPLTLR